MNGPVLLDAGPWAAMFNRREEAHEWCREQAALIRGPLLSCEAALSETCFLLRANRGAALDAVKFVSAGYVSLRFRLDSEIGAVEALMRKYSDVPMSLADACLVRMSELCPDSRVFTLDSDFQIYRKNGRHVIPTIMPRDV